MFTRKQASEASGGATAPAGRTSQSLAGMRGASGTPPRNGPTRPATLNNLPRERRLDDPSQGNPARSPQTQRRRIRWSRQDNLDLMRAYFIVTNAGQDKTHYRNKLYGQWRSVRPDFPRESQQLSDQVRSIIRRKVLSEAEIEQLKQDAGDHNSEDNNEHRMVHQERSTEIRRRSTIFEIQPTDVPNEIRNALSENMFEYAGVPFRERPSLPKLRYSRVAKDAVTQTNRAIEEHLTNCANLEETCHLVYCAALTVLELMGIRIKQAKREPNQQKSDPPWEKRLQNRIKTLRKGIGRITSYLGSDSPTARLQKHIKKICRNLKIKHNLPDSRIKLASHLEDLKQKAKSLGSRLRRYRERVDRYRENSLF